MYSLHISLLPLEHSQGIMGWTVRFDIQHLLGNRPISREIHTSVQNRLVYTSVHMPATTVSMHFTLRAFVYEKIAVEMAKRAGSNKIRC